VVGFLKTFTTEGTGRTEEGTEVFGVTTRRGDSLSAIALIA
jgi:hypothetical protein